MAEFGLGKDKIFPHKWAFTLLIPFRNVFLSPKQVISRLALKENMKVLEIGPGPGYFSTKVANILKNGQLVIADIQPEMLHLAKNRIKKQGINNVEYYLCNGITFDFKNETFDRIFMVAVLGEVENKNKYMAEFNRILKNGGILSISELSGDADKMTIESLKELGKHSNFNFLDQYIKKWSYTVNFIKK
jgi:ubiquinone/menaquinone biosynthesis C-methylase UbiE